MISIKKRLLTALILFFICIIVTLGALYTSRWYVLLFIIPILVLMYDVCCSKCTFNNETVTIRTGQYFINKTYTWNMFKDVKIDRFYPWGRIVLIKNNNKLVYVYCDNPISTCELFSKIIRKSK